jgi:hypothetical protein
MICTQRLKSILKLQQASLGNSHMIAASFPVPLVWVLLEEESV